MINAPHDDIIHIPLHEPWWHVLWLQRIPLAMVIGGEIAVNAFETLIPLLFCTILQAARYDYFILFIASWFGIIFLQRAIRRLHATIALRSIHSLHLSAHQLFLTVDPLHHSKTENGTVLGKIERASRGFEYLLEAALQDFLGYATGIITVLITLAFQSICIALALTVLLLIIGYINVKLAHQLIIPHEESVIQADDQVRSTSLENIANVQLTRSYFASDEINTKLTAFTKCLLHNERTLWHANIQLGTVIKVLYLLTMSVLGAYLISMVRGQLLSITAAVSIMAMYVEGTYGIINIERPIRVVLKSLTRIHDFFAFINTCGKATYPVLQQSVAVAPQPQWAKPFHTSVILSDIVFVYPDGKPLFNRHNLALHVVDMQANKMYGIVGPSGTGKSTLLYILGGQLKPQQGTVYINGIDIYAVDDIQRKKLITFQGQTPHVMHGTVRYNLLFGLPENTSITDSRLIILLIQLGVWSVFAEQQGLDTLIGDGGITLSTAQRQRLSFASLYLRVQAFKPAIILLDEPTSSLDEKSAEIIASVIAELARHTLTFVVGHRSQILLHAHAILDCSRMHLIKKLKFVDYATFLYHALYYNQVAQS